MIKPNKKIGIVYSNNSKSYADQLVQIITEYQKKGYCIEPVKVDSNLIDQETDIELRIFNNLKKCSYAFVFLTMDMHIEDNIYEYISKPNVLLELGFFIGCLNRNSIVCVIDFPYDEIIENKYMNPSDMPARFYESIDKNNFKNGLKKVFDNFIMARKHEIIKLKNYNANDMISSLILNSKYKTDFKELFTNNQISLIEKYSIDWQLDEIFKIWYKEKNMLNDVGQLIYLYERIVFLPFFPIETINDRLNEFLTVIINDKSSYLSTCYNILRHIADYEEYKRHRHSFNNRNFFLDKAQEINNETKILKESDVAPIIKCITQNYIGLCYLNAYFASGDMKEESKNDLEYALHCFEDVIKLSQESLGDSMFVFQAFANYNIARAKRNLGANADTNYIEAIHKREFLSNDKSFPKIFNINFALEKIYAEIDFYDYMLEINSINEEEYNKKIIELYNDLNKIRVTPAENVSLFKTLEDKLIQRKSRTNTF